MTGDGKATTSWAPFFPPTMGANVCHIPCKQRLGADLQSQFWVFYQH